MYWKTGLIVFHSFLLLATCHPPPQDEIEIIEVSELPDPDKIPYPKAASMCLCRTATGEKILVAIPAIENRKVLSNFTKLKTGTKIRAQLILWPDRPAVARAMAIANDFAEEFELKVYFTERVDFTK
jgi:hypothetical protein